MPSAEEINLWCRRQDASVATRATQQPHPQQSGGSVRNPALTGAPRRRAVKRTGAGGWVAGERGGGWWRRHGGVEGPLPCAVPCPTLLRLLSLRAEHAIGFHLACTRRADPGRLGVATGQQGRFGVANDTFVLDGKPTLILSGSIHYWRIPAPYWEHRLSMLRDMGLNTIETCARHTTPATIPSRTAST